MSIHYVVLASFLTFAPFASCDCDRDSPREDRIEDRAERRENRVEGRQESGADIHIDLTPNR